MSLLFFRNADETSHEEVTDLHPLPVRVLEDLQSQFIRVNGDQAKQVSVSTSTATLIAQANQNRRSLLLTNLTGTQICYLGENSQVSSSNARSLLSGVVGSSMTIYAKDAIYGLSVTAAQTVMVWEEEYVNG